MLALLARMLGNVFLGLCLSSCGIFFMMLLLAVSNLPRILTSLRNLLRGALRFSFACYATLLGWLRGPFYEVTQIDLFRPVPRTIATTLLSVALGCAGLMLFNLPGWVWVVLICHGLFIGLAWEQIIANDSFRMGEKLT